MVTEPLHSFKLEGLLLHCFTLETHRARRPSKTLSPDTFYLNLIKFGHRYIHAHETQHPHTCADTVCTADGIRFRGPRAFRSGSYDDVKDGARRDSASMESTTAGPSPKQVQPSASKLRLGQLLLSLCSADGLRAERPRSLSLSLFLSLWVRPPSPSAPLSGHFLCAASVNSC